MDEETIKILEQIDFKFSQINRTLKSINNKVEKIKHINKTNIENVTPWISFFNLKTPSAPLIIEEDGEPLEKFDIKALPLIFQEDGEIQNVYDIIKKNRKIQVCKFIKMYDENEKDKILVFIDLLVKKRFIRHDNDFLYC